VSAVEVAMRHEEKHESKVVRKRKDVSFKEDVAGLRVDGFRDAEDVEMELGLDDGSVPELNCGAFAVLSKGTRWDCMSPSILLSVRFHS
jgi:hypothetical protein